MTSIDTPKSSIEFKYDSFDELISRNDGKICETYDYDSMGRRTNTFENGIIKERLIYDNAGNLSNKISNLLSTGTELKPGTYYADAYLYSYDKNGRLISENRRIKSKS